jgi:glycerol transport system ATP-binding protein
VVRVDDVGRERVVRLELAGHALAAVLREDEPLPPEPRLRFDPAGVHLYADGWRVPLAGEDDYGVGAGAGDERRARA